LIKQKEIANSITSEQLSNIIIEAIQDKKGYEIVRLDLREIEEGSADFFVICQGTSPRELFALEDLWGDAKITRHNDVNY